MTQTKVKNKVLKYKWTPWIERPVGVFFLSTLKGSSSRQAMRKIGIDLEMEAGIFERGRWYESQEVWRSSEKDVKKYLSAGGTVAEILAGAEKFYREKKKEILEMMLSPENDFSRLKKLQKIMQTAFSYIWVTHCLEYAFTNILNEEVPKYFKGDVKKFIGDISVPKKKNAHTLMIEAIRRGEDLKEVVKEFGWIKVRDVFSSPFTVAELAKEKKEIINAHEDAGARVAVPKQLKKLAAEVQALVFFRTFRTDVYYEFSFLARPLLRKIAAHFGLRFQDLKDYCIYDLAAGKAIRRHPNLIVYKSEMFFSAKPVLPEDVIGNKEIKGQVAFPGLVRGTVKIIKIAHETDKIKEGDILVTQMTFPSYVLAMKKAAAFVTDEGGITCHAAIIARELKKPCIIGTKIATKVLHDGDLVEVDANKGVVTIIKK